MAFATHTIRKLKFASIYFWRINHSTIVYYIHICGNQVSREIAFARIGNSTISTTRCAGMRWIEPRYGNSQQRMPIQPLQECLQHTQFEKWSLWESNSGESTNSTTVYDIHICENQVSRENTFARIINSTNSTTRCTDICWMEPRKEIVSKEWQFNHFNGVCNTHNLKI